MSHPINDEILDNYREELDRVRNNHECLIEAASELWLAYNASPQDREIQWLNGKFSALKECLGFPSDAMTIESSIGKKSIHDLIAAAKELADLYECDYGRGDEYCHNEAWGVDHLTSCPKLVAEKAIEKVRKYL